MSDLDSKPQDAAPNTGVSDPALPPSSPAVADDDKADRAADALDDMLELMDFDVEVEIREDGERIVLDVDGPDVGHVIGKKGQTLDALQFLLNKMVNREPEGRRHVILDSGDYRERHDRSLETMAQREAKRAVEQGKVITLRPMSARDRRVVHLSLAKLDTVTTASSGEGTRRRVQIIPSS